MEKIRRWLNAVLIVTMVAGVTFAALSCSETKPPDNVRKIYLKGTPYERGFKHGETFKYEIRSIYTRLLTNALIPSLNVEQISIAPVLGKYYEPIYLDGNFSYQMMLESGRHLMDNGYIPEQYIEEMHGISDGSGVHFDKILLMNTFMDTMMGFRAVSLFIQNTQKPYITRVEFVGLDADGADNDGDGKVDEEGEGIIEDYEPTPHALFVEVPEDTVIKMTMKDDLLGGISCIDPENVTPLQDERMEASCINEDCLAVRCRGKDYVTPDCMEVSRAQCVDPSKADTCFDPGCEDKLDKKCLEEFEPWCSGTLIPLNCFGTECKWSVNPDCLNDATYQCLEPKLALACFNPDCVEPIDPECIQQDSIRIQLNEDLYIAPHESIEPELIPIEGEDKGGNAYVTESNPYNEECQGFVVVTFTPPGGLSESSIQSLLVQATDKSSIYAPAPWHPRTMRDERIVFTTKGFKEKEGYGEKPYEIGNKGEPDDRYMPVTISFAARGEATPDGNPIAAHHYMLIDGDIIHEHAVLFVQEPDEGYPHAYLGYTGFLGAFSGMNSEGLAYAVNNSDSLDSPLVGSILDSIFEPENLTEIINAPDLSGLSKILDDVGLVATGLPIFMTGRELLANNADSASALENLYSVGRTFGWNFLLMDAQGDMIAVETDGATQPKRDEEPGTSPMAINEDGFMFYRPAVEDPDCRDAEEPSEDLDSHCRPWASLGADDIRMSSHFVKNADDMRPNTLLGPFSPRYQRGWTGFYYRSLRSFFVLEEEMNERMGQINVQGAIDILREPYLVDTRDSMNAVVFEPASKKFHWAVGEVPATDGPFEAFDLDQALQEGRVP